MTTLKVYLVSFRRLRSFDMDAFLAMKKMEHCLRNIRSWMLNDNLKLNSNKNSSSLGHHNNYWETLITFSARVVEWNIEPVPIISSKISVSGFIPGCLCQQTSQIYAAFHFTSTLFTTLENISHNNQLRPSLVRSLKPK